MKTSRFSEEQIAYKLRQADGGTPVGDVCRQLGVSEATFYVWKTKYEKLGLSELPQIRQLGDENTRLKRLLADLTLDKHILSEVLKKESEAGTTAAAGCLDPADLPGEHCPFVSADPIHPRRLIPQEYGSGTRRRCRCGFMILLTHVRGPAIRGSLCCCAGRAGRSTASEFGVCIGSRVCSCACGSVAASTCVCWRTHTARGTYALVNVSLVKRDEATCSKVCWIGP